MSRISRSTVIFLLIHLVFYPLVDALKKRGHRLCRQEPVRNPGHVKRPCNPCPSGKYRSIRVDQCLRCRNCTDLQREFSKTCARHNNAECGECIESYWDEYLANSQASDDGNQKPCQHCRFDVTNSKECSTYTAKLTQETKTSIQVITTARTENTTNHSKEERVQGGEETERNPSQSIHIYHNVTLLGYLLVVLVIILIIYVSVRICTKIIKVFNKYPGQETSIGRSYTNKVEEGYRSMPYAFQCSGRCHTPKMCQCTRDGYVKDPPVWTKTFVAEGMPSKHSHSDTNKAEDANEMLTSLGKVIKLHPSLSKDGLSILDGRPTSDHLKGTLDDSDRPPKRDKRKDRRGQFDNGLSADVWQRAEYKTDGSISNSFTRRK